MFQNNEWIVGGGLLLPGFRYQYQQCLGTTTGTDSLTNMQASGQTFAEYSNKYKKHWY